MSLLERDWSTKPIIYIINNSFAIRYVTSQIWKYYGIFGFVPNERGRIHEHKAPFHKQLSAQAFKVYSFVSLWETHSESAHGHCVGGFVLKRATHGICCSSSAGGYQTALHYCGRPLLDWGELPVFIVRHRTEMSVSVRYEYVPCHPLIYIHILQILTKLQYDVENSALPKQE